MALLKCKMCGGDIIVNENQTYGTCDSCGSTMTLPKIDDERRANAFNRANHFRRQNEFDKAINAYERILNEDNTDAEAHWGIVLSRYGIEYVEDPKTHERIPTCHRVQTNSILADIDYLAAIEHAPDGYTRSLYEEEAKRIFGIQKGILAISDREDPYDVFICYKETSENGTRTKDSAIAQDVYYQLTNEGYKVFFSRITLEDKLGQQYEPYIFAALNSAKVMVVIGTKRENYEAVWVKNEWLRYLDLMKKDRSKLLIPCYSDMDAYDLPEELSMIQSQDMSKIGFIQDLIRGVKKVLEAGKGKPSEQATSKPVEAIVAPSVMSLYERGKIFLEDGEWKNASDYFDRVLDIDPKFAPAYIGRLCAQTQKISEADLVKNLKPLTEYGDYTKAIRFVDKSYTETLSGYNQVILDRIEYERQDAIYQRALDHMKIAIEKIEGTSEQTRIKAEAYFQAKLLFDNVMMHKEAIAKSKECATAIGELKAKSERLAEQERYECEMQRVEQNRLAEERRIEAERLANKQRLFKKKQKERSLISISTLVIIIAFLFSLIFLIIPKGHYVDAKALLAKEDYEGALAEFAKAGNFKDAKECVQSVHYLYAEALIAKEDYEMAAAEFAKAGNFKDAEERVQSVHYLYAETLIAREDYEGAIAEFVKAGSYKDARKQAGNCLSQFKVEISAGFYHTVGLRADDLVMAVGNNPFGECDVSGWKDIVAISAGDSFSVGLKADGTVVAVGDNDCGQCDVDGWQDIVAISAGGSHTIGLKADGTVVAVGDNEDGQCNVDSWQDIVEISTGYSFTVGLKADGTVVAIGNNDYRQCKVAVLQDIVAISAGGLHTVGLKTDGMVVAVGNNDYGQCDVGGWQDIVTISAGKYHTVGLKADGTVVAVGYNWDDQCDVDGWQDIVAISAGGSHTIGLKGDGKVVAAGHNALGECEVTSWKLW